jgi:uncharacterized protein
VPATDVIQSSISFSRLQNVTIGQLREVLEGDPKQAARWLESAAKYGLVEAQTAFAQILLDGRGVPRDARAAANWFAIAAGAGYIPAINMLGRCCEHGWGLEIDLPRAADCYRRAAESGLDWGEYNYANLLLRGRGVIKDRPAAFAFYRRAAARGHAKSINMVGRFIEEGWETPADFGAAADCYRRAAEAGDFRGQYNLASVLARGGDISRAKTWLHRAMETATTEFLLVMAARLAKSPEPALRRIGELAAARAGLASNPAAA